MILLIDNYDSFVYNLYQYLGEIDPDIRVYRNDQITIETIKTLDPSHIVLSPGPGHPKDTHICLDIIRDLEADYPILGVCLGQQAIGYVHGSDIDYSKEVLHGKKSPIIIENSDSILKGIESLEAARYHSLVINKHKLSPQLEVLARSEDGEIMAIKHKQYPVYGLQFHPESILTNQGRQIIKNFLKVGRL
ncbi:MAG: anthranilate synthase component II [Bacillota bacterium]